MAEAPIDFVCNHTRGHEDQPPEHIPIHLYGRGNARSDVMSSHLSEPTIDEETGEEVLAQAPLVGSHDLRCPTCGFTERIRGEDVDRLVAWAKREHEPSVPLMSARRILRLIG